MTINDLLKERQLTKYKLSKLSGIPYSTISDLCSEKTLLEKCSVETLYKLSQELGVSMDDIIKPYFDNRCNFEIYKSNVCHSVKNLGDIGFIVQTLEENSIRKFFDKKWYAESLYLLAMLDYLSNCNDIPLCEEFEDIRKHKLKNIVYPSSILALNSVSKNKDAKAEAVENSIPEFIRFNIVESEIRDVI